MFYQPSLVDKWKITQDNKSGTTQLQSLGRTGYSQGARLPWEISHGHEVTDDGWILSSAKKRILWLPHHWRSKEYHREWSRTHMGLLHSELPDIIILEFIE